MKKNIACITAVLFCLQLILTFMPETAVFAAESLINIIENGDMESNEVSSKWIVSGSSAGSRLESVVDSKNSDNRVLRFNGSTNTGSISYMQYSDNLLSGKEYYYSFKIRIAEEDKNTGSLYLYSSITPAVNNTARPLLSNEWVTRSGYITGNNNKLSFKIISSQASSSSNVTNVIYELDDVVICDMSDSVVCSPVQYLDGALLSWKTGVISSGADFYTRADSDASFSLKPPIGREIDTVSVNGNQIVEVNGTYTFHMPSDLACIINVTTKADSGIPNIMSVTPDSKVINADPDNTVMTVEYDRNMDISLMTAENIIVSPTASFYAEPGEQPFGYNLCFDTLLPATEYSVTFTEGLTSALGVALKEPATVSFKTASPVVNLIENGDMSNNVVLSMYSDNNSNSTAYGTVDGNSVLCWKVPWTNAPLTQYLNSDDRQEKYDFIGGHRYYVKAKVKSETQVRMVWSILYSTDNDTTATHPLSWITLSPNTWTVIQNVFTVPTNVVPTASGYGVRLVAGSYPHNVYIDDIELYDCSVAVGGKPTLVSTTPENNASDVEPGTVNMLLEFDKPMLPSTVNSSTITVENGTLEDSVLSDDKKSCTLTLSEIKVNRTVSVGLKGICSMAGEELDSQSVSFNTKIISTNTPMLVSSAPQNDSVVAKSNLEMKIEYDLPIEGPISKADITSVPDNLIENVDWSFDTPNVINIELNKDCLISGNSYSVTLLPTIKSQAATPILQQTIGFKIMTSDEIISKIKAAVSDKVVNDTVDTIKKYYPDLDFDNILVNDVVINDAELAVLFAEKLHSNGIASDAPVDKVTETIRSLAILTVANYSANADYIRQSLEAAITNRNMTGLLQTYNTLSDESKISICNSIAGMKNDFVSESEYADYIQKSIISMSFAKANGYMSVSNIFKNNTGFFSIATNSLIGTVDSLSNSAEVYSKLQGLSASNEEDIYNALKSAYDAFGKKQSNALGGGGGSGGGSKAAVALGAVSLSEPDAIEVKDFNDIDTVPWASNAIKYLYDLNVINGKAEGLFYPNDFVTREEFVKMLVAAAGIPLDEGAAEYADVSKEDWFYPYISAATSAKLVKGIDDNNFGTGQNIVRQDIAVIFNRLLTGIEVDISEAEGIISDYDEVSDYANEAVLRLVALDIITGDENQSFAPKSKATRAETAVLLQRLLALLNVEEK